jgi:hypothetical protein
MGGQVKERLMAARREGRGSMTRGGEPHKTPSYGECQHCPVTPEDCGDRVQTEKAYQGETDEF